VIIAEKTLVETIQVVGVSEIQGALIVVSLVWAHWGLLATLKIAAKFDDYR